ncbi:Lsr2 family protein [Nocardia sp. NPDC048505]|uniref:histone-like nucleoid-structuring protein Lsr2 n=1 Tax=Nocardia sp. NPDC048505 TaxID=3155756 RepID=UPI0033FD41BD
MAVRIVTFEEFIDDIDGAVVEKVENISFSVRGQEYEIDLGEANAKAFDEMWAPFVAKARKVKRKQGTKAPSSAGTKRRRSVQSRDEAKAIREWASKNGHGVSPRGRITDEIRAAYKADQKPAAQAGSDGSASPKKAD